MHSMKTPRRGRRPGPDEEKTKTSVAISAGVCALSALLAVASVSSWYARFGPPARARQGAIAFLEEVQDKERIFRKATETYAPTFPALGVRAPNASSGWTYRLVTTRLGGRPRLLVEADDGTHRVALDGQGRLYQSDLVPLPSP